MWDDTITRLRAPDVIGPDGATIPGSWATTSEGQLDTVSYLGEFQPILSTEEIVGQQRTLSTHKAYLPAGADVLATDRLRFLGVDYSIEGDPLRFRLDGAEHHVEVLAFRVTGD